MITHTRLQIEINGKAMPGCLSFALSQPIHGHHTFRAEFSGKSIESDPLSLAADSLQLAGTEIKAEFSNSKSQSSVFKGIISSVHSTGSNQSGYTQNVVFEGYSPTILLENGPSCQAFTDMGLKDILLKATQGNPENLLKINLKPRHSATLPYTVQYNETAFAFADRLSRRFGEWCYYDGLEFVIGEKQADEVTLCYGQNLLSFDFGMQTGPVHQSFSTYGYKTNEKLNGETSASDTAINGTAAMAMETSDKTWKVPSPAFLHQFDEESALQGQMDEVTKLSIQGAAARKVSFKGAGTHPGLFPGTIISVTSAGEQARELGRYIISQVEHQYAEGGHYQNHFQAVPFEAEVSPLTSTQLFPQAAPQPGIVTDNNDPEGLGRVKVQLHWQPDTTTPWIRMARPYSGSDKGMFFVPEIDEEVIVGFEHNNAEKPYVIGSLYHGNAKPDSWKTDMNDVKAIRTRSGHTIELNDADGKEMITITDKGGSIIQFDTAEKSLFITAPENLEISAKNIKISAEENIEIGAKKQIDIAATKDMNLLADGALALQAQKDLTAKSKTANITLEATKDAVLTGMNVTAEGQVKAGLAGTQTTVAGKITMVQGAAGKTQWT